MVSVPIPEARPIRVVLVDDHELVRRGIRQALSADRQIRVVGEATSDQEAISLLGRLQPDVALMDIRLRQGSGIDVTKAAKAIAPGTRVLILTAYDYDKYVTALMKLGAVGYLLKTTSAQQLKQAVHDAAEGKVVVDREIAARAMGFGGFRLAGAAGASAGERPPSLTAREVEVLDHMGKGLRNREIADSMGISLKTVETYVERILLKLRVKSRTQAVLRVITGGE